MPSKRALYVLVACVATTVVAHASASRAATAADASTGAGVVTYHNDTFRTGWDKREFALTTTNVNPATFGLLATVPLDEQADATPLVLAEQLFTNTAVPGRYDVAYVATANDSIYAIDTATGTILAQRNFGTPVPAVCGNNGPVVGITSTPVIDRARNALYLIAYTSENGADVYRIHAIDIRTLADLVAPVVVSASHTLANGTTAALDPTTNRQRAALLESNGVVYAGFSSFCDGAANKTRGWVLGWEANTLAPLASNDLTDTLATSQSNFFLNAVWMSGAGIAADETGTLYFTTSNSDPTSYDGVNDIQESFVRESADLTTVQGLFTPSNQAALDARDFDYGAGGVLLLPYQKHGATVHRIGAAAGKDGNLYVVNRDALGGFSASGNNVLGTYPIGGCWCAPDYFVGADGMPRIVTSGGSRVAVWRVQTAPSVALIGESTSPPLSTGQDPGFFTSVSSNDTAPGTAIVWAVSRPTTRSPADVSLYAFDASNAASELFTAVAGTWPNTTADANIVPVVANARVLVASDKQLAIFGLLPAGTAARAAVRIAAAAPRPLGRGLHEIYGRIDAVAGTRLLLQTRGRTLAIDVAEAERAYATTRLYAGEYVRVRARETTRSALAAIEIERAKSSPALWAPDR